jgi:hypothetical protein
MLYDIKPLLASLDAFGSAQAKADRERLLTDVCDQLENLRAADERSLAELEAAAELGGAVAERAVRAALEDEAAIVEELHPRILSLHRYLINTSWSDDPEAHHILQQAINVILGYFAGYQNLRSHLLRPEIEQRESERGVQGEIDHAALTREIIARFPKILAALAK